MARKPNPRDESTFRGDKDNVITSSGLATQTSQTERKSTMSMIDPSEWNLDDAQEPTTVPDGSECRLRIIEVTKGIDRNGMNYFMPRLEIVDEPYSKDLTHFLHEPNGKMNAKRLNQVKYNMKQFIKAFEIDLGRPTDPSEDWLNHEGWAILGLRNDAQYGDQNYIKQLIVSK